VLAVNVWKEPDISRSVPVRSDGKISLPLVGELQASGQTPQQLEQEITKRLQNYISEPEVTVIVTDSKSQKVNILGMVSRPGAYLLTSSTTVLDAVAMAGGFKDFAKQKSIYVLRQAPDGTQQRIPFNYKDVIKARIRSKIFACKLAIPWWFRSGDDEYSTLLDSRMAGGWVASSLGRAESARAEPTVPEFQQWFRQQ